MNRFGLIPTAALLLSLTACVSKKRFDDLQGNLTGAQSQLASTKDELDKTKGALAELQGLKPELDAKNAALKSATEQLEQARARLSELDEAQRKMEESLKSEIEDKTIRLQKLKDRLTVTFVDKILFDSGSAQIKDIGKKSLKKVADSLKEMANHNIYVEGHTDNANIGPVLAKTFPTNWELSAARSTAVTRFLQETGGLEPTRLFAVGCSSYRPVADNATTEGKSENRRVEIVLIPRPSDEATTVTP